MNYYNVGKIVNTHGLRGEVRIISTTDFATERYKKNQELVILDNGKIIDRVTVSAHRKHKNFDILLFTNYNTINDVEKYKGMTLAVSEDYLSELETDEFYYHEIIGLNVYQNNQLIGKIKEILDLGSNDVWVVQRMNQKDVLIPYIKDFVLLVDVKNNRVEIADIDGLLD